MADPAAAATDPVALTPSLRALAGRGLVRRYRKGAVLMEEGDHGDTLYVLLEGRVKACSVDVRDREVVYGVYGPGELLGEMSLDGGPRSATVITLEPSMYSVVTRQTLLGHIAAQPEFALELLARVIRRARMATRSARNLALLDAYGRLAALLQELASDEMDGTRMITPRPTHRDLASRVGCSREMVSRLMKDLVNGGYVSRNGRTIVLRRGLPSKW